MSRLGYKRDARILVVDDEDGIRRALGRMLEEAGYTCELAANASDASRILDADTPDLVLSDVNLRGISGIWLLERLAHRQPHTVMVMVTGLDDTGLAERCLDLGAYGYIVKPFERNEILVNVANALRRQAVEIENLSHRRILEDQVAERTAGLQSAMERLSASDRALRSAYEETVRRLANAAESRDETTGKHLQRMSAYAGLIARLAGLDPDRAEMIRLASPMHDIGKVAIPDQVLQKPGPFTDDDRAVMQRHPQIGHDLLAGSDSALLRLGGMIALTHHERFDGTGYPRGLSGAQIPIEGRIVAIADVFDALTTARSYKPAFPIETAFDMLIAERGRHFDPDLVDLFIKASAEAEAIAAGGGAVTGRVLPGTG